MAQGTLYANVQFALVKARISRRFVCLFIFRDCLDDNLKFPLLENRTVALGVEGAQFVGADLMNNRVFSLTNYTLTLPAPLGCRGPVLLQ